jgi:hypothetical protein
MLKRHLPILLVTTLTLSLVLADLFTDFGPVNADATPPASPPWVMPVEVQNPTQAAWNDFGYQSFIALIWPASGNYRGEPNPELLPGATDNKGAFLPTVWETYNQPSELFLPRATPPPGWNAPPPTVTCPDHTFTSRWFSSVSKASDAKVSQLSQASFPGLTTNLSGAVVDQNKNFVWYEQRLNESWWDYIVDHKYYDAVNQQNATANGGLIPSLPDGAAKNFVQPLPDFARQGVVELKASWRVLEKTDDASRYYHVTAALVDPTGTVTCNVQLGLVGLHILRLTPSSHTSWVWFTFEQVDNTEVPAGSKIKPSFNPGGSPAPQYLGGYQIGDKEQNPPLPPIHVAVHQPLPPKDQRTVSNISRVDAIPANATKANGKYHGLAPIKGTVWQYYQLIGSQVGGVTDASSTCTVAGFYGATPSAAATPGAAPYALNACKLSNTSMESYVQGVSCIACHSYAAPLGDSGHNGPYGYSPNNQIFSFMLGDAQSSIPTPFPPGTPAATASQ